MELSITKTQGSFINAVADEVLFGGAAGGGKSYGQMIDALYYALRYPVSRQLILRRTYPELERSLIRTAVEIYPRNIYRYNTQKKSITFRNMSVIDFGYCDSDTDVIRYQSSQYDVIRFDELTHFTKYMYIYLLSRLRGANNFPKMMKSTTNPGGIGHDWVRDRFIDIGPPMEEVKTENGSRVFIPSKIADNTFLMASDPGYIRRLENLPEKEKQALLYGDWDILSGRYFTEFSREKNIGRFDIIPPGAQVFRSIDYGLDRLVCLWIWMDSVGNVTVFRELCESDLIISAAAKKIEENTHEDISFTTAPPDLWSRQRDAGLTAAAIFSQGGVDLTAAPNRRVDGWMAVKEALASGQLMIDERCTELIKCLSTISHSEQNPNDCALNPHHLTHAPDALRYFIASGIGPMEAVKKNNSVRSFVEYGT